ncbi:MAG: glycosyltransferase family 2 protein [Marmoricola sp.]
MLTPDLSVVIPVYNEEEVLPLLVERLRPVLDGLGATYEVIAVDDGSTDTSAILLQRYRREWPNVRILRLRANAGHQAAISAGLAATRGGYAVTFDADLQDPPETIAEMLAVARAEGVDVVYGVRSDRSSDSMFKRHSANAFYRLVKRVTGTQARVSAGDFRLMSRVTIEAVNGLPEAHRVLRFAVPALGFPSRTVEYRREPRAAGTSKYSLGHMVRLAVDSFTGFSIGPLRLATWFGLVGSLAAAALLCFAVVAEVIGSTVPGWTSIVAAVAGFGALQLLCLGLMGEYVGRVYMMLQGRPTYFVAYDSLSAEIDPGDRSVLVPEATSGRQPSSGAASGGQQADTR